MARVTFEVVPHPRFRGEWLLKPTRGVPFGLRFRDRQFAINHAEWVAAETDRAEILVYGTDGAVAKRRLLQKNVPEGEQASMKSLAGGMTGTSSSL